jgi:ABC-type branched-subunit amino acid transport system ATPase component
MSTSDWSRPGGGRQDRNVLAVCDMAKAFGGLKVFNGISFRIEPGEVLGVIGPNGAGKTTLINVICGMLRPSSGTIQFDGGNIGGRSFHAVSRLGIVRSFQQTITFRTASVRENLTRAIRFSGSGGVAWAQIGELLDAFGLGPVLDEPSDSLPYGSQKILGLLMAYAANPKMLLLDEPAAGLESRERTRIDRLVLHAREHLGCGILIVEHDMDLIRRLCPRLIVLEAGGVLAQGAPGEVLARSDVIQAYLGQSEDEADRDAATRRTARAAH